MAFTDPRTWSAGEIPTATIFNTHVRDNFNALRRVALVRRVANIAGTAAEVDIQWDTEDLDDFSAWTSGANTKLTAAEAGRYGATLQTFWASGTGTGSCIVKIKRYNSSDVLQETIAEFHQGFVNGSTNITGFCVMSAGDYLTASQNTGTTGTAGNITARMVFQRRG